jgi:hypothetical protein
MDMYISLHMNIHDIHINTSTAAQLMLLMMLEVINPLVCIM